MRDKTGSRLRGYDLAWVGAALLGGIGRIVMANTNSVGIALGADPTQPGPGITLGAALAALVPAVVIAAVTLLLPRFRVVFAGIVAGFVALLYAASWIISQTEQISVIQVPDVLADMIPVWVFAAFFPACGMLLLAALSRRPRRTSGGGIMLTLAVIGFVLMVLSFVLVGGPVFLLLPVGSLVVTIGMVGWVRADGAMGVSVSPQASVRPRDQEK